MIPRQPIQISLLTLIGLQLLFPAVPAFAGNDNGRSSAPNNSQFATQTQLMTFSQSLESRLASETRQPEIQGAFDKTEHESIWTQPTYEKKLYEVGERLIEANNLKGPILFRIETEDNTKFNDVTAHAESDHKIVEVGNRLFHYFRSDDELAAVLSHELAHISLGKSGWLIAPGPGLGILDLIGNIIFLPDAVESAFTMGKSTARFMNRGFNLKREIQADLLGIQYMVKAGYDPMAMETILTQIASDSDSKHWRGRTQLTKRLKAIHTEIADKYPQYLLPHEQAAPNLDPMQNGTALPASHMPDLSKPFADMKNIGNSNNAAERENGNNMMPSLLPSAEDLDRRLQK